MKEIFLQFGVLNIKIGHPEVRFLMIMCQLQKSSRKS